MEICVSFGFLTLTHSHKHSLLLTLNPPTTTICLKSQIAELESTVRSTGEHAQALQVDVARLSQDLIVYVLFVNRNCILEKYSFVSHLSEFVFGAHDCCLNVSLRFLTTHAAKKPSLRRSVISLQQARKYVHHWICCRLSCGRLLSQNRDCLFFVLSACIYPWVVRYVNH